MAYRTPSPTQRQLHLASTAAPASTTGSPAAANSYSSNGNSGNGAASAIRPASRAASANYASVTSLSNLGGAAANSSTPAGTPSRRQNKRSSVTVMWPDAVAPSSTAGSRVSSAGGHRPGVESTYPPGMGSTNLNPLHNSPATASAIPIPTAPKRPSLNGGAFAAAAASATAAATTAAAAGGAGPAARRAPRSPSEPGAPSVASYTGGSGAGVAAVRPNSPGLPSQPNTGNGYTGAYNNNNTNNTNTNNGAVPPRGSLLSQNSPQRVPPLPPAPLNPNATGAVAGRVLSASSQRTATPPWLHSPAFSSADTNTSNENRRTPEHAELAVGAAATTAGHHPARSTLAGHDATSAPLAETLSPPPQQQQQQQQQPQSYNTNGVCEGIVSGVRHAGGEAGLYGPTALNGIPNLPPPYAVYAAGAGMPSSQMHPYNNNNNNNNTNYAAGSYPVPLFAQPSSSALMPNSSLLMPTTATTITSSSGADGRRGSGRYTGPALPQYATSGDGVPVSNEKRTSNPFASYSTELMAAELARPSSAGVGGGGILAFPASGGSGGLGLMQTGGGLGIDDSANTTELILYQQQQQQLLLLQQQQQQQQQQMQLYQQRASAVLQRHTDDCNDGLQQMLTEAQHASAQAEARLLDDGLSLIEDWMRTRDLFFSAGALFAAVGDADSAARCLLHATFINRAFHNDDEARTTLAMSVEQLQHTHPQVAVEALLRLAACYAARTLRYQTAKCYKDAAELLETRLGQKTRAVELYRTALEIYAETQSAAKSLARRWEKQQRQTAQRTPSSTALERTSATTAVKDPHNSSFASAGGFFNFSSNNKNNQNNTTNEMSLSLSKGAQAPRSSSDVDVTLMNLKAGLPPPHYQVSTTVQRSLIEACRGRLLVLLTQLHAYPEVLEVALTCAESVPRALPRTKFLLCATLSVLARGAPPPVVSEDGMPVGTTTTTTSPPTADPASTRGSGAAGNAFMSAAAEAADTAYFDSLYDTEKIFSVLQEEDRTFQRGKENELVRALLAANKACSLTMFDEAVRTYKGYASTEPSVVQDLLLEQCRCCLYQHVERFA